MRKFITDDKERVGKWVAGKLKKTSGWYQYQALGVEEDGELIAGVVFDNYLVNARCHMHCAGIGRRWLSRTFLNMCFDYAFRQMNCRVVINTVDSTNADSLRFTRHVGFKEVYRVPHGNGDSDLAIFTLHREDCRWIGA